MKLWNDHFSSDIIAFTSYRENLFTLKKSHPPLSSEQKAILYSQLGEDSIKLINIRQVHGNRVLVVNDEYLSEEVQEADALLTDLSDIALLVRTADCLPVFIFDPVQKVIGLIHAGWRGTEKKIVVQTIKAMIQKYGSVPVDLRVVLGPCIQSCCYEVSGEFYSRFSSFVSIRDQKYFLNLTKVNLAQLEELGVLYPNIFNSGECTCCDQKYFSYRREGNRSGRMVSLVMLRRKGD